MSGISSLHIITMENAIYEIRSIVFNKNKKPLMYGVKETIDKVKKVFDNTISVLRFEAATLQPQYRIMPDIEEKYTIEQITTIQNKMGQIRDTLNSVIKTHAGYGYYYNGKEVIEELKYITGDCLAPWEIDAHRCFKKK